MLEEDETTLRDGFRLKKIGNLHVILDENGMQVGSPCRIETLAVKRLLDQRIGNIRDQKEADHA
ncbi:MAG: hypothetical protein AAGI37_06790 [Planctomycetota bacterium]